MTRGYDDITDNFTSLDPSGEFDDDEPTLPLIPHLMGQDLRHRPSPPRLERIEGDSGPHLIELGAQPVTIGRSTTADVVLDNASLSRKHARIEQLEHESVLTDLDSRNGVFLNGLRVHSAVLRDRDTVQIGSVVYLFRDRS